MTYLPPAIDGCTCLCHTQPGIMHFVACCGAGSLPASRSGFECPICGNDKPHHHTQAVVDAYQNKRSRSTTPTSSSQQMIENRADAALSHTAQTEGDRS